jgi:hypothetical protein
LEMGDPPLLQAKVCIEKNGSSSSNYMPVIVKRDLSRSTGGIVNGDNGITYACRQHDDEGSARREELLEAIHYNMGRI